MYRLLACSTLILTSIAFSADATGTWKLNTSKSTYTGMPAPKDLTVTYVPEGSGWRYQGSGTSATGEPIKTGFTFVKDGADVSTSGFPNWDTLVLTNAAQAKTTGVIKRDGKTVGTLTRILSPDGKTMTIRGNVTTREGKTASYVSVYEKQ